MEIRASDWIEDCWTTCMNCPRAISRIRIGIPKKKSAKKYGTRNEPPY
jgi:hypothetical protein